MILVDHPAVFPPVAPAAVVRTVVPRELTAPVDFREFWWYLHSAVRGPSAPSVSATAHPQRKEGRDA